jgi:hypothetical protein
MRWKLSSRESPDIQRDTLWFTEVRGARFSVGFRSAFSTEFLEKLPWLLLSCTVAATHGVGRFAHNNGVEYARYARRTAPPLCGSAAVHARRYALNTPRRY